jgi:hypothetical protein
LLTTVHTHLCVQHTHTPTTLETVLFCMQWREWFDLGAANMSIETLIPKLWAVANGTP